MGFAMFWSLCAHIGFANKCRVTTIVLHIREEELGWVGSRNKSFFYSDLADVGH